MFVEEIKPNGFCGGVKNAIKKITKHIDNFKKPVYMLGYLIHNKYVISALKELGIIVLDCSEESANKIESGTAIITAHGVSKKIYTILKDKDIDIVNTTCYNVQKIHEIVERKINENYNVYIIGKESHPEIKGILGISDNVEIYSDINLKEKAFICNQTTLNYKTLNETFNEIKKKNPTAEINNEVCSATRERQEAIRNNAYKYDLIIVVGDTLSNNTDSLYKVCLEEGVSSIKVETLDDINKYDLSKYKNVGITSGASTPKVFLDEIKNALLTYDKNIIYKSNINIIDLLKI